MGIDATDTGCLIPRSGDGAVCVKHEDCRSGSCLGGRCCNVGGVGGKCKECGQMGGQCTKCKTGYKLVGIECVDECSCSAGCIDCDCGTCLSCDAATHFLHDGRCRIKSGDGKLCNSDEECLSNSCMDGHCCKVSVAKTCVKCNSRGKCQECKKGYTLCGHHLEEQGFCKRTRKKTKETAFKCGTGGTGSDWPSTDG